MSEVSRNSKRPIKWGPNQPLDHRRLNESLDAIEQLQDQVFGPRQVVGSRQSFGVEEFTFLSDAEDYFLAVPISDLGEDSVAIAKPYTLRNSLAARGDLTFTYTNNQTRTADNGSETETQVIVPGYLVDDVVYAMRAISPTNIIYTRDDGSDGDVVWVDLNVDGRQWAKQAE